MKPLALATYSGQSEPMPDDEALIAELQKRGFAAQLVVWDAPDAVWEEYAAVILRSTWDYHLKARDFEAWLEGLEQQGIPLWNPPEVVRWNMEKSYLRDLAERGLAIVPTVWLLGGSRVNLAAVLEAKGWRQAVVKPSISASAYQTWVVSEDQAVELQEEFQALLSRSSVLVQQFVEQVPNEGEWSFLFFDQGYSHAVLKRAKQGEFRVQEEFGGYLQATQPSEALVTQAQEIVAAVEAPLLYARVDGVEVDGQLLLMELELIEPYLFLGQDPDAARLFAEAISQFVNKH